MDTRRFLTDRPDTARRGWYFLVLALLLNLFLQVLPEHVGWLGLTGTVGLVEIAAGTLIVLGCLYLFSELLLRVQGWYGLLEGWPPGAVRRLPWARLSAMSVIGLSLVFVDQLWPALTFCIVLLQFTRDAERGRVENLRRLGAMLWDLKICWFSLVLGKLVISPQAPVEASQLVASLVLLVVAISLQNFPRQSFALCFLESRPSSQTTFERQLWLTRLERVLLITLSIFMTCRPDLPVLLSLYCGGRILLCLSLRRIYKIPRWKAVLRSELGPWECPLHPEFQIVVADQASFAPFLARMTTETKPVDRFGDGPLSESVVPPPRRTKHPEHTLPFEALLAGMILVITVYSGLPRGVLPAQEQAMLNFQTRAVETQEGLVLYHCDEAAGVARLVHELPYPKRAVQVGRETSVLTMATILLGVAACFFRWRYTILGMWGFQPRKPDYKLHLVCLSLLGTIGVTSWLGWFWFPPQAALLTLTVLALQRPLPTFSRAQTNRLFEQLGGLFSTPLSRDPSFSVYRNSWMEAARSDELLIEVSRELLFLVDPRTKAPLVQNQELRSQFRKAVGFELPQIRYRDNLWLKDFEYRVLVNEVEIFKSDLVVSVFLKPEDTAMVEEVASRARAKISQALRENAHLFATCDAVERYLNAATRFDRGLVRTVRERHPRRTVKKVLKALVEARHHLDEPRRWLKLLARAEGSDDQIVEQTLRGIGRKPR